MAKFIKLTRKGSPPVQPSVLALVNVDHILLAYPSASGGTTILYGKEHTVTFEDAIEKVEDLISNGPYVRDDHG